MFNPSRVIPLTKIFIRVNKELIIRSNSSAVDFALLKDGKLIELNQEIEDNKFSVGDIFVGKMTLTYQCLLMALLLLHLTRCVC